ncbi:S8 family serine peptidase [Spirosoma endophyticum]|uniref:Putative metal-binding motif-containing protein n=1 Tax=Spirosoma endophyticum TaxID=662367 RepID=A0A1I2CRQ5_9BACT|nr:S8 family serine peptidase [Spirosoma endophyticum]SFE70904.1 Putative metal-binding motif-containing protein [Spirosoma endophyticum]
MTRFYAFFSTLTRFILPGLCVLLGALPFGSQAQVGKLPQVNNNFPLKSPAQTQASSLTAGNQGQPTASQAIAGQYIVVYKKTSTAQARVMSIPSFPQRQQLMREEANATLLKNKLSGKSILHVYDTALKGFAVSGLTGAEVDKLRQDDQVAYIVPDQTVFLNDVDAPTMLAASCNGPSITLNGVTNYAVGTATFGSTGSVSGEVILVNDGSAPVTDGCGVIQNNIAGKIALIDRGTCDFVAKATNAQQAGAIGVIIVNNAAGDAPNMSGTSPVVTIPVLSLSLNDGNALKTALTTGTVTAILDRQLPDALSQCIPWGISRVGGGASGVGKRAWIIDSGIDLTHPDLNVNTGLSTTFVPNTTSAADINGHGTHVAGTIAAKDNGFGVIGVAAGAEVVAVRVFLDETGTVSTIVAGVNYVAAHAASADVVNMSLGGAPSQAIDDAVLALSGVCKVVVAAGNDAKNANYVSPARVNGSNIVTVSAMDIYGKIASFSNYGNGPVDYSAPGVNVASCYINNGYAYLSGTSMAAPHVAGILLLGTICASSKITGDPDGTPDLIATVFNAANNVDNDHDNVTVCGGDYDDNDATVYPGAPELCDNKDNNQNGQIDEGTACCPAGLTAGILYVNASATGANNGLSWASAFTSLQAALTAAKRCTQVAQIWVAKGTYYPGVDAFGNANPTDPRTRSFAMQNNLAIYGGFAGNEPSNFNLNQRNLGTNPTILSGDIQQDNSLANNSYHVILNFPAYGNPLTSTAILDGFTVRDGVANFVVTSGTTSNLSVPDSYGGGLYSYGSSPSIRNCTIYNNVAYVGGGMMNNTSNANLLFNYFIANVGFVSGGGLANASASPTLAYSAFAANSTTSTGSAGGGVYNDASSPTLVNCFFQLNNSQYGGGVANFNTSNPTLTNCSFSGNSAALVGGGIYNYNGSSPTIKNSIIWGNSTEVSSQPASSTISVSVPLLTYSIIQGGWSGSGSNNLNLDPRFISQPVIGSVVLGDLSLASCSPAINAGDPATTAATAGTFDVAGNPRFYNGGRIDMGAYEFQGSPTTLPTAGLTASGLLSTPGASVTLTASPATGVTYVFSAGATQLNGGNLASVTQAGTYSVVVTAAAGCSSTASTTVALAPDLISILYVQPTTLYGTTNLSVVVKVAELNQVATTGPVVIRFARDPLLTLSFDPNQTLVAGRPVQNSGWVFDTSNGDFYTLTNNQPNAASNSRSVGLTGQFLPGNTKGSLGVSMVVQGAGVGELRVDNNSDAEKIDYFNK